MKQTRCVDCNKLIDYTTKKPKWCKTCKAKKPKTYRKSKRKPIPQHSKREWQVKQVLNEIFPQAGYIDNGYYSFLLSPKGSPLQLDRYYPKLKLAIEVDGSQHKKYNPYIHKTKEEFEYLQECDRLKDQLCKEAGLQLIRISHDKKITKAYLLERLMHEGALDRLKRLTDINTDIG